TASRMPTATAPFRALRACGRLIVMTCTAPCRSTSTSSLIPSPAARASRGLSGPAVLDPQHADHTPDGRVYDLPGAVRDRVRVPVRHGILLFGRRARWSGRRSWGPTARG